MTHTGPRGCLPRGPQDKLRHLGAYGRTATETLGSELGYTPYTTYALVAESLKSIYIINVLCYYMFYIQHPTLPRPTVPWASSPGPTSGAPLTNPGAGKSIQFPSPAPGGVQPAPPPRGERPRACRAARAYRLPQVRTARGRSNDPVQTPTCAAVYTHYAVVQYSALPAAPPDVRRVTW